MINSFLCGWGEDYTVPGPCKESDNLIDGFHIEAGDEGYLLTTGAEITPHHTAKPYLLLHTELTYCLYTEFNLYKFPDGVLSSSISGLYLSAIPKNNSNSASFFEDRRPMSLEG